MTPLAVITKVKIAFIRAMIIVQWRHYLLMGTETSPVRGSEIIYAVITDKILLLWRCNLLLDNGCWTL